MLSICYITNRKEPKFQWFLDSLKNQLVEVPIQLIIVDYNKEDRPALESLAVALLENRVEVIHVDPLPSAVQGKHRITKGEYFSASNARNTGFAYAKYDYIVFVDDLSVLMPDWLNTVMEAVRQNYVVLGCYEKRWNMVVENGVLLESEQREIGKDPRARQVLHDGKKKVGGEWLFGCSFGMPLQLALQINGFDTISDMIGGEDQLFGIRLSRTGVPIFYDKRMFTVESDELHHVEGNQFIRIDPETTKEKYTELMKKYGIDAEINHQRYDASHAQLDILQLHPHVSISFYNRFDLKNIRHKIQSGQQVTLSDMCPPETFWFTGENLKYM